MNLDVQTSSQVYQSIAWKYKRGWPDNLVIVQENFVLELWYRCMLSSFLIGHRNEWARPSHLVMNLCTFFSHGSSACIQHWYEAGMWYHITEWNSDIDLLGKNVQNLRSAKLPSLQIEFQILQLLKLLGALAAVTRRARSRLEADSGWTHLLADVLGLRTPGGVDGDGG